MNFYFQEIPASKTLNGYGFTKTEYAYTNLEDLFMFLNFPERTMLGALRNYFIPLIAPKRTKILDTSNVADKIFFIAKGAVRVYTINEAKEDQTELLLTEGSMITCLKGFLDQKLSERNIITTEDSILLTISYEDFTRMLNEMPGTLKVFVNALSRKVFFQQELGTILKTDTKTKFEFLQGRLSEVYNRFPLKYQASFLGIKPETLSRIRGVKLMYNNHNKIA